MTLRASFLAGLVAVFLLGGCQTDTSNSDASADDSADTTAAAQTERELPEWGYSGDIAPANWDDLDAAYAECAGAEQSPIDLPASTESMTEATVEAEYSAVDGRLVDTGHAVQVDLGGGTLMSGGTTYELIQFHFHTPSEHTVDGQSYPGEVHLVHASEDGQLAVVGVFYEEGAANSALAPVWNQFGAIGESPTVTLNAADLLPDDRTAYIYDGSLTTPPCSEIVRWHVMKTPVTLSAEQLDALRAVHDDNARPVQDLEGRSVQQVAIQ
jgi:carbonic anhydrase